MVSIPFIPVVPLSAKQRMPKPRHVFQAERGFSESRGKAARIMGASNVLFPETAAKAFSFSHDFSSEDFEIFDEVPYSTATLLRCRDTHLLVAQLPLAIIEIMASIPDGGLCSDNWYANEGFARDRLRRGWRLISKRFLVDSVNETYEQQQARIINQEDFPRERRLRAVQAFYFLNLYHYIFSEHFLKNMFIWSSNKGWYDRQVTVGVTVNSNGEARIRISDLDPDQPDARTGLLTYLEAD